LSERSASRTNSVFLNLPFDQEYESIFVGFVVGLVSLGLEPRSVLELDEDGDGRISRLFRLLQECGSSVHDISYRGPGLRYNMPFELGLAYALSRLRPSHRLVVFEAEKWDLLKTLSDLRGFDPKIHGMKGEKALAMIYECFSSPTIRDAEPRGKQIYKAIVHDLENFRDGRHTIFNKKSFLYLVYVVTTAMGN
jgi:hypothetical protein